MCALVDLVTLKRVFESLQELNDSDLVRVLDLLQFNLGAYASIILVQDTSVVKIVPARVFFQINRVLI